MQEERYSFEEVEAAWTRCANANPTEPPAHAMCPDAGAIADVYARMLTFGLASVPRHEVTEKAQAAISRWAPDQSSAT